MDDALPLVDLDRRPVGLHGGGLAAGDGSTKLAGEGRLWMMRCAPLISIVAQSVSMEVSLPPEMAARSGEGRLWMMRCAPLISIAAQSPLMELILPPEMRQQTGAVQVVQGARWMTSEQGQRIPAQVGREFGPGLPLIK